MKSLKDLCCKNISLKDTKNLDIPLDQIKIIAAYTIFKFMKYTQKKCIYCIIYKQESGKFVYNAKYDKSKSQYIMIKGWQCNKCNSYENCTYCHTSKRELGRYFDVSVYDKTRDINIIIEGWKCTNCLFFCDY